MVAVLFSVNSPFIKRAPLAGGVFAVTGLLSARQEIHFSWSMSHLPAGWDGCCYSQLEALCRGSGGGSVTAAVTG